MQGAAVIMAEVIHGIIAAACVAAGIVALIKGHSVYRDRGQDGKAKMLIQMPHLKITAQSFGAVMMATAFGWGALGVYAIPNVKASPQEVEVYSFITPGGNVEAPVVSTTVPAQGSGSPTEGLDLVDAFGSGVLSAGTPAIRGKPAQVRNVHSITRGGMTFLVATLQSKDTAAVVQYNTTLFPLKSGEAKVVFKPVSVSALTTRKQTQ